MNWSDETLIAFADRELDAAQNALLQVALQNDPAIRQRIDGLLYQRQRLGAAFASVLDEPLPERLVQCLRSPVASEAPSTTLPESHQKTSFVATLGRYWQAFAQQVWPTSTGGTWGALAASVMLGVLLGTQWRPGGNPDIGLAVHGGRLLAEGTIAQALASQLANAPQVDPSVSVQLSFIDQSGNYCRTFTTPGLAGLACLETKGWAVQVLTPSDRSTSGEVRQAASGLPPAILDAVDQRIAGSPFDAAGEKAARTRGWRP